MYKLCLLSLRQLHAAAAGLCGAGGAQAAPRAAQHGLDGHSGALPQVE